MKELAKRSKKDNNSVCRDYLLYHDYNHIGSLETCIQWFVALRTQVHWSDHYTTTTPSMV